MKVLHITRDFPPPTNGGISTAVSGMVGALQSTGIGTGVISFDDWRPASGAGKGSRAGAGPDEAGRLFRIRGSSDLKTAREWGKRFEPDLLHVHHGMLWDFAKNLSSDLGVPTVKTVHVVQERMNSLRAVTGTTLSLIGQRRALAEATAIHIPSQAAARALAHELPNAKCVFVIPFGIHPSRAAEQSVAARRNGYRGEHVLYFGRFDDAKGTDLLPHIWKEVASRHPGLFLVIAGGLPANARRDRKWRQQLLEGLPRPARERVRLPGWVGETERDRLLARAAVLLSPSRYETFGLAVVEAMLAGVPVVATRAGALPERIRHGETGLLAEDENADELAAGVTELLGNPDRARGMGLAAEREVRKKGLWERIVKEYEGMYRGLTNG